MVKFETQRETQQFICRMVAIGYYWWLSGLARNKAEVDARHAQYAEHYGCSLSPARKHAQKEKGIATSHFIVCPTPPEVLEGGYTWYLLATDGIGPIRENGKLKDARLDPGRITWNDEYVLYLAPRHRDEGGGEHWSWYLKPERQRELNDYVTYLLRHAPHELRGFFESQIRRPMHHGIRVYLTRLLIRAHQNFGRMYPGRPWPARDPNVPLPIIVGYRKYGGAPEA